jgi:microcystin-dependent protein
MSNFFLGQIGVFGFNFAPRGWAQCTGTILPITQNTALFALIGTFYGGNGTSTFALPDLRSRTSIGYDGQFPLGEAAGAESITLISTQLPQHTHLMGALSTNGDAVKIDNNIFALPVRPTNPPQTEKAYGPATNPVTLNAQSVSIVGGNQSHNNIQPLLAVNFCIATSGIFPSRN